MNSIEMILLNARGTILRYLPTEAVVAHAMIIDLRSHDERAVTGIIPGSVHVPRSVLEWRADPDSGWSNPRIADRQLPLILMCAEGYSSTLAAESLVKLGFEHVGDIEGGFEAWQAAGLPVVPAPPPEPGLPGMGGPQ
ncbi:MAG TPA: rhodanese-like domain-containing protein [Gaiellaceae bacterium]